MESTQNAIVHVTPLALQKMKQLLEEQGLSAIRLSVLGGGCAGLQYDMHPTNDRLEGDFVQGVEEMVLYIHPVAVAYLKGTTVDYSEAMVDGGFKFINPNASNTCGCGTSFGI
ncbi:MAG: HesB/IscA family protein [Vampirovibrionales bacterium]